MKEWTAEELATIGGAEELRVAGRRDDSGLREPVTVWSVRLGDHLYVRSVNGRGAAWFRGIQARHEGRVWAGGVEKEVRFVETDDANDAVDDAYKAKYARYPSIVPHILASAARAATLELVPLGEDDAIGTNTRRREQ
ncbi:MAG TPA: DUF2255 family protein [Candidatus Limnocylindrales bacterium]|nr:DUF2255 family protein [Candidatus Limnocylindrales bacterium]